MTTTTRRADGSTASLSGNAQRAVQYSYDMTAEHCRRPTARDLARYGTQTLIKTSTGIWNVTYNAKNRPVRFEKRDNSIVVECTYKAPEGLKGDWTNTQSLPRRGERPMRWARINTMGRRATKKVTTNGSVTEHRRFLYRGYLQIDSPPPHRRLTPSGQSRFAHCPTGLTAVGRLACCGLTRAYTPALWYILWDPTQPTATRPLAIQKNGTWYSAPARLAPQGSRSQVCSRLGVWLLKPHPAYGWDLTKNICETYRTDGRIDLAYTYTPYGEVTPAHTYDQPLRWSSEYHDTELGLVYYNYRHYNPAMGRWIGRDIIHNISGESLYHYSKNSVSRLTDYLGAVITSDMGSLYSLSLLDDLKNVDNQQYTANPQDGYNVCQRYTQTPVTTCFQGDRCEMDSYPQKAKIACDGFISMYTKKGKLRNSVLCVAKCLTEAENTNKMINCCNARNSARLFSHFSCYMKCGFVMDLFSKNNFGVPKGGWEIGLTLLLPDLVSYLADTSATEYGKEGKKYDNSIKLAPQNVKYTNPLIFK